MAVIETILYSDLSRMVSTVPLMGKLFTGDSSANKISFIVLDKGKTPTNLSGGVTGYVRLGNNTSITVNGTLSGNKASVTLPSSAYAVPGPVTITIKIGSTTVGSCSGFVVRSSAGNVINA